MKLTHTLDLDESQTIAVVGGGGKTSFIFTLAREMAALGKRILITTTTAMFNPEYFKSTGDPGAINPKQPFDQLVIGPVENLIREMAENPPKGTGSIVVAGQSLGANGKKLVGYDPMDLAPLRDTPLFDLVLIEADGARMRPVKAPASHEPVIPSHTQMVVGCIGLDCLGTPLDETHAHRPQLLADLSGQPLGQPITQDTLTCLLAAPNGLFKSTVAAKKLLVLNKADTPELIQKGEALSLEAIGKGLADMALVTCLGDENHPVRSKS